MRATVLNIFMHTLAESSIERMFSKSVTYDRGVLRVGDELYDVNSFARVLVVAIGKASHTMVQALSERFGAGVGISGLACGPVLPDAQVFGFRYYKGGHPLPNQDSVKSAEAMLRAVEPLTGRDLVIFMLSGGGSALVEKPIDDSISLEDLIATYRALVHSGAPIAQINTVRKHLSAIKGGRLALAASPAHQLSIMVSDVPENALDSLASGPTMPDTSTVAQCYELVDKYKLLPQFPASVRKLFESRAILETPKPTDAVFSRSRWCTLASNAVAEKVAVEKAVMSGLAIEVDNSCDDWDYVPAADYLLKRLRELRKGVSRVCLDFRRRNHGEGRGQGRSGRPQSALCALLRAKNCRRKHHHPQRRNRRYRRQQRCRWRGGGRHHDGAHPAAGPQRRAGVEGFQFDSPF